MLTVAIGNGRNDRLMLAAAALGFAFILKEGASSDALRSAAWSLMTSWTRSISLRIPCA